MTFLRSLDRVLAKIEFILLVIFLSTMVVLAFTQVVLRNLFGTGLLWADTVVRHLVIWGGFTAAAIATSEDRHISIDALTKFIPVRGRHAAQIFTNLFASVVCYFLMNAAWKFLLDEKAAGGELVLSIPTWIALLIIPVGYGLMAIHFLVKLLERGASAFGARTEAR